jgi:hypothetical protein
MTASQKILNTCFDLYFKAVYHKSVADCRPTGVFGRRFARICVKFGTSQEITSFSYDYQPENVEHLF